MGNVVPVTTEVPTPPLNIIIIFIYWGLRGVHYFFIGAPLAWAESAGWLTPVICLVLYLVIRALMVLGNELEDPFGNHRADHPLEKFCTVVERQCKVVLERHQAAKQQPLHLPPSGRA